MWKIAKGLFGVAHGLAGVAVALIEHERGMRIMTDAIGDLETAQADRDAADAQLADALSAELGRVETDLQHLRTELQNGIGSTDPDRLVRVTQGVIAGAAKIRKMVDQLNAEDPAPAAEPTTPSAPADQPPATNDGGVPATSAPADAPVEVSPSA